ncbi:MULTISPECIES: hypothetical protein [unclassified Mesorhizobium]|uniref:hypothetical protein n=1 Tax=unclassified Mesorhizobium TaxID=325217 RepID=UPI0011263B37|nr:MULTISPECIES: hypothetical protein [unclassified Mesorhizobium]MBZ9983855.1 hypothetical protein [Mesorhizobium sp. BR-1-1-8]TPL24315.1 hypothetical protein FJ952_01995 [Mesorhizobium sp. B2-4-10]TPL36784.1 hypothetical protein FJ947_11095 [Mesorhizobium sp. B2-4-8]TPL66870.1 hypothetical protein FJ949_10980 [Mesorhizobium sp. B2-4-1]
MTAEICSSNKVGGLYAWIGLYEAWSGVVVAIAIIGAIIAATASLDMPILRLPCLRQGEGAAVSN